MINTSVLPSSLVFSTRCSTTRLSSLYAMMELTLIGSVTRERLLLVKGIILQPPTFIVYLPGIPPTACGQPVPGRDISTSGRLLSDGSGARRSQILLRRPALSKADKPARPDALFCFRTVSDAPHEDPPGQAAIRRPARRGRIITAA